MTSFATRQLLRETLIDELQAMPELLRKAEKQYYGSLQRIAEKKERLTATECDMLSSGAITGKNESARQAELWPVTGPLLADIREAETESDRLKLEVFYLRRKLDNLRVMAQLLAERSDMLLPSHFAGWNKTYYV